MSLTQVNSSVFIRHHIISPAVFRVLCWTTDNLRIFSHVERAKTPKSVFSQWFTWQTPLIEGLMCADIKPVKPLPIERHQIFSTCSWSSYSHGWLWMEFTSWALIVLYLNDGISLYGGGRSRSPSAQEQQSFPVNPLHVANPTPGVGGGQAPELVDHWQMIFAHLPVFAAWYFLLPEENKFLSGLESLLCMMTAFFPFYLWTVQSKGIVWMYKALLLQKRNAFACRLWCNSAFCSISFHSFCFSLSASVTVYTTPHFPVCD